MARRRALAAAIAVAAVVVAGPAGAGAGAPITVAGWEPGRGGTSIWDGTPLAMKQVRFLRGARLATVSPSGGGVAFVRFTRDGFDVFHTGVYAGFEARLAHVVSATRSTALAFSPDSRTIAISAPRGIELTSIVPGRGPRLVPLPARWRGSTYQGLRFSPDGRLLAFSRTWGDGRQGTLRNELAVVALDGAGARSLARNPEPYSAQYRPAFSPDGSRIAFAAADGSLAAVPTTGGAAVRLTAPPPAGSSRTDADPVFSPDGSTVAFTRAPGRGGSDVWVVGADGSGLRRLTTTPLPREPGVARTGSSMLAWSPDGTKLLALRRDRLAVADVARRTSTTIARVGVQFELTGALWR